MTDSDLTLTELAILQALNAAGGEMTTAALCEAVMEETELKDDEKQVKS